MLQDKHQIKRNIAGISNLPTLPEVATKLLQIINNANTSSSQIAELIAKDVGITSKVLRMANSAFYGIPRTITTVQNAVVLLGMKVVNSLVLGASVGDLFPAKEEKKGMERLYFWKHSLVCAITGKQLSQKVNCPQALEPEECFCACLLHDIGKLVLDQFYTKDFDIAINLAREEKVTLHEAEKAMFDHPHTEVGEWLTSKWELPSNLRLPIIHHHMPQNALNAQNYAYLVHLADIISHEEGYHCYPDETYPKLNPQTLSVLNINQESIDKIKSNLPEEIEQLEAAFSFTN